MDKGSDHTASTLSRRELLRDAGAAGATVALAFSEPTSALARPQRKRRRETVAIFGGGIAGLTAAHELAERGFDVTIYERRAWGGKARSTEVPGSGHDGRRPLPGEHGWRIFFGFYQNTIESFRRIPFGSNPHGVFDNLVEAPQVMVGRASGHDLVLPLGSLNPRPYTASQIVDLVVGALLENGVPPEDVARFVSRLVVFFSSSDARRDEQWGEVAWNQFVEADQMSPQFRRIVVKGFSEFLQASKAERTSANFPGRVLEWWIYSLLGLGANGPTLRILDRPTNEGLIEPWLDLLRARGVRLRNGCELRRFSVGNGSVNAAHVVGPRGHQVHADWYVCALPVERARRLWSREILTLDPSLSRMRRMSTGWMNGLKIFLREPRPIVEGHVYYADSPWAIGSISQTQFWLPEFASTYGDGGARESLSVIISNWDAPGVVYGKPARQCTPRQIVREAWEQMNRHLADTERLTDDLIHSWEIDPGMISRNGRLVSEDPLVVPVVGEMNNRPDVVTAIPNLLLAGDYVRSPWEIGNMEAASYNARRSVNALLAKTSSNEPEAAAIEPYRPPEWEPFKALDEARFRRGQSNVFDADISVDDLATMLRRLG